MKNVTDSEQKVKGQKRLMAPERASWILGIDIGKEKPDPWTRVRCTWASDALEGQRESDVRAYWVVGW
ncbi:MAG: hypothetical protein Q7J31_05640 [Syntrophales bacterium]|nr:hypothetical protein [Syntrophales bacterium]